MKRQWWAPALIVAMSLFALAVYPSLPARIPVHWNMRGEVDGWGSREFAFLLPLVALALWLLLRFLPRIDPRREQYQHFQDTYFGIINLVVSFLAVIEVLTLGYALGWPVNVTRVVLLVVAAVFFVLGVYLPRVRSNWWLGIRTPWTLSDEQVWHKTHRLAGWTFMMGGIVTLGAVLLPDTVFAWVALAGLVLAGLTPAVYSYFAWRRLRANVP